MISWKNIFTNVFRNVAFLKGHSQLCDRADLDFCQFEKGLLQRYASTTPRNPLQSSQCFIRFSLFYCKPVSEYAFAHPMILFYHISLKKYGSHLQRNMKRRAGKREGAVRKKSPALTEIVREINQKHRTANHHYIYLKNRTFSTWRKVRAEGKFVNDSNFVSWLLVLELIRRRQASVHSRLSP